MSRNNGGWRVQSIGTSLTTKSTRELTWRITGIRNSFKFDLVLNSGVDVRSVRMRFHGEGETMAVEPDGSL